MTEISSESLHPRSGARFVLERIEGTADLRYRVFVYLPDNVRHEGVLNWDDNHTAVLESIPVDHWAFQAALKLARIVHRDPKSKLIRWRDR